MKFLFLLLLICFNVFAQSSAIQPVVELTATTTSAQALAANSERKYLLIQNKGAQSVYVKFDSAIATTEGVLIVAGGNYEPYKVPTNSVHVKAASATSALVIYEGK